MAKRNALGKGLGALIDNAKTLNQPGMTEVELTKIEANPFQPRTHFDKEALEELATSIKEIGLIQPITLRKVSDDKYQIIAGERRFRASQLAGLKAIPAFVRKADDDGMLEMALVENIQREDLDAIEIALSYKRLMDECNLTQELLSTRVGKRRSTISNYLRLLKLPAVIQKGLRDKKVSMGHARTLINIEDEDMQIAMYEQVVENDYSVRKTEEMVRQINEGNRQSTKQSSSKYPAKYQTIVAEINKKFDVTTNFSINEKGKGKIVIPFKSQEELERIVKIIETAK